MQQKGSGVGHICCVTHAKAAAFQHADAQHATSLPSNETSPLTAVAIRICSSKLCRDEKVIWQLENSTHSK